MGKEQLEKAKKILNHIKGYGVYDGNDDIEIFEWLIEQAERVHGKNHLMGLAGMYEDCNRMVADLTSQNKRYCEALKELIDSWKDNIESTRRHNESDYSNYRVGLIEALQFAIDELEQALEESQ